MSHDKPEEIPINDLHQEDEAHELATSPEMQPYLRLIKAGMQDQDIAPHMEEIAALPLEKRYVWRVASALKWAFADLETVSVNVDRETLSAADLGKGVELLRLRPMQLCIFFESAPGRRGHGTADGRSGGRCQAGRVNGKAGRPTKEHHRTADTFSRTPL